MDESNFDRLVASREAHSALRKGPLPPATEISRAPGLQMEQPRSINSEALFDIRQQAEFFVSLGQTDQAVRILENRIIENGESSPLIYLDLLKILHTVGLESDFHQFREDFNLLFNCKVPEFSAFNDEGKSLDDYPHVLAHITALWATPKALMVIEASIFRDPWDDKSPPFEMAAFRDLLLLHAIAQFKVRREDAALRPAALDPDTFSAAPGAATRHGESQFASRRADNDAPGRSPAAATYLRNGIHAHLNLDLDLDLDLDLTVDAGQALQPSNLRLDRADFPLTIPGIAISGVPRAHGNGASSGSGAPVMAASVDLAGGPARPVVVDGNLIDFELPPMVAGVADGAKNVVGSVVNGVGPEIAPDDKAPFKPETKPGP